MLLIPVKKHVCIIFSYHNISLNLPGYRIIALADLNLKIKFLPKSSSGINNFGVEFKKLKNNSQC